MYPNNNDMGVLTGTVGSRAQNPEINQILMQYPKKKTKLNATSSKI